MAFDLVASEGQRMAGFSDPVHGMDQNHRGSAGAGLPSWERHAQTGGGEREPVSHDCMTTCNPGIGF
ncbi:MAG: hypothetical protein ABIP82_03130 [Nitrospirales bacterium]